MSGYSIANTKVRVYRGSSDNAYGDPQQRTDPDAVVAKDIPAGFKDTTTRVLDETTSTPKTVHALIAQIGAAADRRIPGGGLQVGDVIEDQRRGGRYAVKSRTEPYGTGRTPDRLFDLDRLT